MIIVTLTAITLNNDFLAKEKIQEVEFDVTKNLVHPQAVGTRISQNIELLKLKKSFPK